MASDNEYIYIDGYSMSNRDDVMFGYLDDDLGIVKLPDRDGIDIFGLLKKSFEDGSWVNINIDRNHEAVDNKQNYQSYGNLEAIVKLDKKGFIDDIGNKIDKINSDSHIENMLIPYGCVIKLNEEGKKLKDYYKNNNIKPRFSTYYDVDREDSICDKRNDMRTTIITKIKPITLSILDNKEPAKDLPNNYAVINEKTIENDEKKNLTINENKNKEVVVSMTEEEKKDKKDFINVDEKPQKTEANNEKSCNEDNEKKQDNQVSKNEEENNKQSNNDIDINEKFDKLLILLQELNNKFAGIDKSIASLTDEHKKIAEIEQEKSTNEESKDESKNSSIVDVDSEKVDCEKDPTKCDKAKNNKSTNNQSVNSADKDYIDEIIEGFNF